MKERFIQRQESEFLGNNPFKREHVGQQERARLIDFLMTSVIRSDFFASDSDDEFQIIREDSTPQGIFKVWAPLIIPFLEGGKHEGAEAIETWRCGLEKKPLCLHEVLEQWRAFSEVFDRRLQQVFSNREVPQNVEDAAAELFLRLKIAFAFAAPFYNIEALVADSRENKFGNPINFAETSQGGKLDGVALLLPSALADHVLAERLDWHNLNWEEIQNRVNLMRNDFLEGKESTLARQFVLVARIADLAGVEANEVLFAANALEFIPANVGGKKTDVKQDEAIDALTKLLEEPMADVGTNLVAKDINALIRFLNWFPAIRSSENFQGKLWRYDAVCATANVLLGIVKNNPTLFLVGQFADVFERQLAPQLEEIDATSAKGRFLLQLLEEGKFCKSLTERIERQVDPFVEEVILGLEKIKEEESLIEVSQRAPTFLVGGKANGLRRAIQIFGDEVVLDGKVLTSEAVGEWLAKIEGMEPLVLLLDSSTNIEDKLSIGREIVKRIEETEMATELVDRIKRSSGGRKIVLRSSSFDEDVPLIGPAPGIYESVTDIDSTDVEAISNGLKIVVASFFSVKAISFRELKGLRHKPIFAVLVQEFIDNIGGTVFIDNGEIRMNVAPQPSMINHNNASFDEWSLSNGEERLISESKVLSQEQLVEIVRVARKAEEMFGSSDIEFVVDPKSNKIRILQLRTLQQQTPIDNGREILREPSLIKRIDNLEDLPDIGNLSDINIRIAPQVNLETFQGTLFRWLTVNKQRIISITLEKRIPTTCHFANIVGCLGINLRFSE